MINSWLRLWHDMPNDPKWRTIAKISNQSIPSVIAVYLHMLVCASTSTVRGRIDGWHDEDAASALDLSSEAIESIRQAMYGRVLAKDGTLLGWEKRQPLREDDSAERVRKFRERKAASVTHGNAVKRNVTQCNAPVTQCNDRGEERREEEKERKKEKKEDGSAVFAYRFYGKVIHLTDADYAKWKRAYPYVREFDAVLEERDNWLAGRPESEQKSWFFSTSNALQALNKRAEAQASVC